VALWALGFARASVRARKGGCGSGSSLTIITVFEPIYVDVLNDNMVGFANFTARAMMDQLFITYGNITAVDLENNFEHMRRAWDPQQPVESLFKQIKDCADYSEAGGVIIGHPQQINVVYAKIFATRHFMSACRRWNEKPHAEKTSAQFKANLSAAHRQHKHMQGGVCRNIRFPLSKRRCRAN
jgi:hypothetical protein